MTLVLYRLCDRCGQKMDVNKDYVEVAIRIAHMETEADLCSTCLEQLIEQVNKFIERNEEQNERNL